MACGFNGAVSVALVFSPWGLKRIPYYSTKIIISNSAFGHRKKLKYNTHTRVCLRIFSLVPFFTFPLSHGMKRRGIGVPSDPMRANHAPAPWVRAMIGGSGCVGAGGDGDFSCHVIPGAFLCYCDRCLRAVMGEMRVVISAWGRAWGEE